MRNIGRVPILDRTKAYQGTGSIVNPLVDCYLHIGIIQQFEDIFIFVMTAAGAATGAAAVVTFCATTSTVVAFDASAVVTVGPAAVATYDAAIGPTTAGEGKISSVVEQTEIIVTGNVGHQGE